MTGRTAAFTAAAMVFFASNSLLCRAALAGGHADAASFTTLRIVGGALALGLIVRSRPAPVASSGGGWVSAAALFTYAIGFSMAYLKVTAGTGALLLFGAVQLTMLSASLVGGERPRALEWVGLLISFGGLVALTRPGLAAPDTAGAASMLAAGAAWGVYSLRGRRAGDPLRANADNFARCTPLALLALGAAASIAPLRLTWTGTVLALASGMIASGIGYAIWYAALRGLSGTRAAIVQLSVPPLAAAAGVVLLGESVTRRLVISGLAILGGIALAVSVKAAPSKSEAR